MADDVRYWTTCEDILPHDEHELGEDGTWCIGRQYGPPPMRPDWG